MKRVLSVTWLVLAVCLFVTPAVAEQRVNPNEDCETCFTTSQDGSLDVDWNATTVDASAFRDEVLEYHDGSFESQIGCGGGCAFGVRFSVETPILLTGLTIWTQGDASTVGAIVSIYLDPDAGVAGPPTNPAGPGDGTAVWESAPMDLSSPDGGLTQFDIVIDNLDIGVGDYYVVIWENDTGWMGVANDLQMNYLDRNWVSTGDGFDTITNVVGGDPTLTGNFGISSLFIYQDIEGSYMAVSPGNIDFGVIQIADGAVTADVTINNYGNEDFDVTDVTVVGDGFSTALATPVTVAAGTAVTMDVTFTPTVAGPFAGTFTITGTADNTTTADVNASIMVFDGFPDYFIWTPAPTSSSGAAFMESFGDLGYTAYADPNLFFFGDPLEAGFDAVFICLGIFSDNYSLMDGSPEVTALMAYADAGNPLYMEGGDTWAYDTPTALHSYFNIDGIADGSGDLTMVDGAGLWPDLNYEYLGGNSFIDHLAPLMVDAFVSHINPADGEACGIANLSPSINTLGNSFEFGGLVDAEGPRSTKTELLAAYLDFLAMEYTDLWPPDIGNVTTFTYTLDTEGPYTIEAVVMDNVGVNSVSLFYNADAGAFTEVVMTDLGGGVYTGDIPGYPVGTTVGYYVFADDAEGNEAVDPEEGVYVFDVVSHLPPMYPQAESGLDGTVELEWVTPGDELPPLLDCADFMVDEMPFNVAGTNVGMGDDFDVSGSDGDDVAYQLYVPVAASYTISLCNGTDYDSKLEVFMEDCFTTTGYYNDDACGLQSELTGVFLEAGTYLIVVDGYGGSTGNYVLDVWEEGGRSSEPFVATTIQEELSKMRELGDPITPESISSSPSHYYSVREFRELLNYGIYRNTVSPVIIEAGNLIGTTPDAVTLAYTDHPVTNGTTYFYRISAIYDDGEAASAEVSATPMNHPPAPPMNLVGVVDNMTVTLDWDDNTEYDFDHYNVYRNDEFITTAATSDYAETLETGGFYTYFVTAVDAEDAESDESNDETYGVGNLPPMYLEAESGLDGTVNLEWLEPGHLGPDPLECADVVVMELPFTEINTNAGMGDDFDVAASDGEDIAYQVWMMDDGYLTVTLCSPNTDYDTKLEIFNEDCFTTTGIYNDDDFTCVEGGLMSSLYDVFLPEGNYLIVVDGFGGAVGNFEITITEGAGGRSMASSYDPALETQKLADAGLELAPHEMSSAPTRIRNLREFIGYHVYRDAVQITTELLSVDALAYTDQYIPNGVEYCYSVEAVYDEGGNSMSNVACATPMNHPPMPPMNLDFVIDDHDITLDWDDNTDYDLASYNVYRDGELVANVTESTFAENLPISNIYRYHVTAVDAEAAESGNSNTVFLPVGNLPPSNANAEGGLDGRVELTWMEPGIIPGEGFVQDFESGMWPPEGWTHIQTNGFASWQLYDDILGSPAYEGVFSAGTWWDFEHQDEWMISHEFTVGAGDLLTFWSYAQQASIYGDHYYVKISIDGGASWDVLLDMTALPPFDNPANPGWNDWQVPYTVELGDYAGQNAMLAWHAIDVNDPGDPNYPGLWYIWMVDAITVGPEWDLPRWTANTGLFGLRPENASRADFTGTFRRAPHAPFEQVVHTTPLRERSPLVDYSIHRSETSPVAIDGTDLLATVDTLTFAYTDFPLTNGVTMYYIITANYTDEISASAELEATPVNHPPAAPTGLTGVGDENSNVDLDWDDNTDYDFASYNVYRDGEFVVNVAVSEFSEVTAEPGVFEYFVTAVDAEAAESMPSEPVDVPTGPLPPGFVSATSGIDGQVYLEWTEPGNEIMEFTVEIFTDNFPGETTWDLYDEAGTLVANDGGSITTAATLYTWPLEIAPSVYTFTIYDAWGDGICCSYGEGYYNLYLNGVVIASGGDFGTSESWTFDAGGLVTLRSNSTYVGTPVGIKGSEPANMASLPIHIENTPINIQYDVLVERERSFDGYTVYRDGVDVSGLLPTTTMDYLDGYIPNGVEYCYTVSAVYTSAETHSDLVCATPMNHPPMAPMNLVGSVDDGTGAVSLDWDDNTDYDLASYNIYRNGEFLVNVTASDYQESPEDGVYDYRVTAVDAEDAESDPSNRVQVIVGEAPPENLRANGDFDDQIVLNWMPPGGGGIDTEFRYDDDVVVAQLGYTGAVENSAMGASHPVNSELHSVSWYLTAEGGPHTEIKVVVLGLDEFGIPDVNQVLHVSDLVPNTDDMWNDYALPEPVLAENGFFIGINTPFLFTALAMDDGVDAPWEFIWGTQWATADFTNPAEAWLDVGEAGFPANFMIRGYGMAFEELARDYDRNEHRAEKEDYMVFTYGEIDPVDVTRNWAPANESLRDIANYNVYRDGDLIGTPTETTYTDMVDEGIEYLYEVTATYTNGEDSSPSNAVFAMANMAPGPPTNVTFTVAGHNVTLEWVDPELNMDGSPCVDLEGIKILRDGAEIAIVDPLEWTFTDVGAPDGGHEYALIAFDEVPNYGAPALEWPWVGPAPYMLHILTDNFPGETSWDIVDDSGNYMMGITGGELFEAGVLHEWLLAPGPLGPGTYTFTIYDAWGDGICCAYGEGYYQIIHGAEVLAQGGDFGTEESVTFTVEDPILYGDVNGDGILDILDLTRLIEIVTFTGDPPSPEEIDVIDLNADGLFNVLDVVILIEAILDFTPLAKGTPAEAGTAAVEVPATTLQNSREWQDIPVSITYEGMISGFQADIAFDPEVIELGTPTLAEGNDNVSVYANTQDGLMRVLAVDLSGGQISVETGLLMNVPVQVIDPEYTGPTDFTIEDLIVAGPGGVAIETDFVVSVIEVGLPLPDKFALQQNYPNPFNPSTTIHYELPEAVDVTLVVYNMLGQAVRTLVASHQDAGYYDMIWNGHNDQGQLLPTGVYIYHLRAGEYSKTFKMAYIK